MATNSNTLVNLIYKSRKTMLELLKQQGFSIDTYNNFSINEVHIMVGNKQLDMLLHVDKERENDIGMTSKSVFVKYHLAKTLRHPNIYEYIEDLIEVEEYIKPTDTLIIVVKEEPNDTLVNIVKHIWETQNVFVVLYNINRLQFNPLMHKLVPPHRIMTKIEEEEMKKHYNITENSELPEISRFDPIAQAIGMKPGQVCEITRPSKTAIETKYYRLCQ